MTATKVTPKLIEKIKELRADGWTQEAIACELKMTQGTVSRVLRQHKLGGHLIKVSKDDRSQTRG